MTENTADQQKPAPEPTSPTWRSRALLSFAAISLLALFLTTYRITEAASAAHRGALLCDAVHEWQRKYSGDDLRVLVTDVTFRASPAHFVEGEGAVVAPLAIDLPSFEEVLDVRADPAPLRVLHVEGHTAIAWAYAARIHRDLTYEAVALVRIAPRRERVPLPDSPTFSSLPDPWRVDARQTAEELEGEEHALSECKDFVAKARAMAGPPPYTDQLLRILQKLRPLRRDPLRAHAGDEDLCAALRSGSLDLHGIQVLATLALRELGAPALGFATADPLHLYLVGTYVDGLGWITVDVNSPTGYGTGLAPAITMAPLTAPFDGAQHGFWYASAGAYAQGFGRTRTLSSTRWAVSATGSDDVTVPRSLRLDEACP